MIYTNCFILKSHTTIPDNIFDFQHNIFLSSIGLSDLRVVRL